MWVCWCSVARKLIKISKDSRWLLQCYKSNQIAQDFKRANIKNFLGKAKYLEVNHEFYIEGKIQRNVVKFEQNNFPVFRIAEEQFEYQTTCARLDLLKPKMDENIQIFFIWLFGRNVGLIAFKA